MGSLQKALPEFQLVAKDQNEIQIQTPAGPLNVYLDNVRASCAARPAACDGELDVFVSRIASVARLPRDGEVLTPEKLFVVLRSAGFGARIGSQAAGDAAKVTVVQPFVEGLELLYVLDTPKTLRFINQGDLEKAGLSVERLREIAVGNAGKLPALKYGPAPNMADVFFMPAGDGLGTSRVFDSAMWDRIEKEIGGAVVVSAPTRDWLLFVKQENREAVDKLRELVNRIVRGEAYPVSPVLFYRNNGNWQAFKGS